MNDLLTVPELKDTTYTKSIIDAAVLELARAFDLINRKILEHKIHASPKAIKLINT